MNCRGLGQDPQISRVGGENVVTIGRQADNRRVDSVGCSAASQQNAGSAAQCIIDGSDVSSGKQPGQVGLTRAAAPHLSNHSSAGHWRSPSQPLSLYQSDDSPVATLGSQECPSIQNQCHAAPGP